MQRLFALWICFALTAAAPLGLSAAECPRGKVDVGIAEGLWKKPNKDYAGIEAALERAAGKCPEWEIPQQYLGVINQERGRHREAIPYFQKALELNEKDFASALYLGDSFAALGNDIHAARYYFIGTRIIEDDIDLRYEYSEVLEDYTEKRKRYKEKTGYVDAVEVAAKIGENKRLGGKPKIDTSVEFDTGKAVIKHDWTAQLDTIAEVMTHSSSGKFRYIIQGHTDERGSASDNDALSMRRARAVREYLVDKGVSQSVLSIDGKGERRNLPCRSGENRQACWRKNRRVVFISCLKGESDAVCLEKADAD